ncbi:MmcQ/YjbR family DNA-binding protein [Chitiniphilus shinanonensis]|uniref:MmcQ/YjbR family DNA-binding protein n=1 Tax=Chitiniphilus shinanonensis TaxID=553088 RepID=UPI0030589FDF
MKDIDHLFKNRKLNPARLAPFGFVPTGSGHTYSTDLLDGQFEMTVTIARDGKISAEVLDNASREPYVLHRVSDATGAFVGKVREEYQGVLDRIVEACFERDVFKSEYAKQVIRYVRETYQDELQFLWQKFPENAIFRRKDNAKWYAALLVLQKKKLGLDEDATIDIIDLRAAPEDIEALVDGEKYFPGFHMNKKHWLTICLDGSVPIEEILRRIDESFVLARG